MFTEVYSPEEVSGASPAVVLPVLSDELFQVLHVAIGVTVDFVTSILILLTPFISPPLDHVTGSHFATYTTVVELFGAPLLYASVACGAWITAIISLERCICVLLPLKVKLFFTHRTTTLLLLGIFVYQVTFIFVNFVSFRVKMETSDATNITSLVLDTASFDDQLYIFAYFSAVTVPSFFCMAIILVGTVLLIIKLQKSAQWRMNAASAASHGAGVSVKEMRLIRIVVFICGIFITCFCPNMLVYLTSAVFPKFQYRDPQFGRLFTIAAEVAILSQLISCALNFFVYVKMNSKFRRTLKFILCNKKIAIFSTGPVTVLASHGRPHHR
ncbi:hypothetical protein RRG08_061191 [Elysia crispata]|uniref:G-protein coupled receptors family 1 profile domain-containing protein n=1 Tax=Elysia crispata TaxID=231223 RepID=A0AAE0ZPB0_9GAST|nr:hypothetical protein RRG08_061191 [Elysia crispata]